MYTSNSGNILELAAGVGLPLACALPPGLAAGLQLAAWLACRQALPLACSLPGRSVLHLVLQYTVMTHARRVSGTLVLTTPTGAPGPAFCRELEDLDAGGGAKFGMGHDCHA